jgi:hypothetical protein
MPVTQFWDSGLAALGPEESWTIHGEQVTVSVADHQACGPTSERSRQGGDPALTT